MMSRHRHAATANTIALRNPPLWEPRGLLSKAGARVKRWLALAGLGVPELDRDEVAIRAYLAAGYISSAQLPDGTFAYEYDFVEGRFLDKNSIVRQAGAGFALAEYLNRSRRMEFRSSVERAISAFAAASIAFDKGLLVTVDGKLSEAKTGATALALLAELNYFAATGDERFAATRRGWLCALGVLQRTTGGFAAGPANETESPYFNGESWLALAEFVRLFPGDETARAALEKADPYLMRRYSENPDGSFFHWGMMAAATRFETSADERFLDFIAGQAEVYLSKLRPKLKKNSNSGSAVEGLAAGATALAKGGRGSGRLYRRILLRLVRELEKSCEMQILRGQETITVLDKLITLPTGIDFAGAFLNGRRQPQTRIDITQHCLSALLKYNAFRQVTAAAK
jgi:hypothetical protein